MTRATQRHVPYTAETVAIRPGQIAVVSALGRVIDIVETLTSWRCRAWRYNADNTWTQMA